MKHFSWLCAAFTVLALLGCGGAGITGGSAVEVPEYGLTMNAPSGWRVHAPGSALICSKKDSTGTVIVEKLEGRGFNEYVGQLLTEFGGKTVSRDAVSVSGYEAVRAVVEYPSQGSKSMQLYIRRADELIQVSFTAPAGDFPGYESSFRDSIASIKIK